MPLAQFIGIPYLDRGTDPAVGLDCWQLVKHFYETELDIVIPNYMTFYGSSMDIKSVQGAMNEGFREWTKIDTPAFSDVLVFRITQSPWHVGVCLDDGLMLHTLQGSNSCVEKYESIRWRNRLYGAYRWN